MTGPLQLVSELDNGETIPNIVCPDCGGDVVKRTAGAWCDWCDAYVPIVGLLAYLPETEASEETDEDG